MSDAEKPVKKPVPGKNGGTLYPGGVPGNKPGTGRPPAYLKALMAEVSDLAWTILQQRLTNPEELDKISTRDLASIADAPTKYLIPKQVAEEATDKGPEVIAVGDYERNETNPTSTGTQDGPEEISPNS